LTHSAFAVWFKDLERWSVNSFFRIDWQWPDEYIKPLKVALKRKELLVDKKQHPFETLQLVTLHFDGTMEPRDLRGKTRFKGNLYFANAGDVIYSKIDVRNGAIGVVPDELPCIAVSSEYPVYEVAPGVALPGYIKLLFRTSYFQKAINSMISGASGRKRVQSEQIEEVEIPLPPLEQQRDIVAQWQQAQTELEDAQGAWQEVIDGLNTTLFALYEASSSQDILRQRALSVEWKDLDCWDTKTARATAFRLATPTFEPMGEFAEESTELVKPWEQPEKEWPVYGVNNKEGVVFSHHQKGKDFNAACKHIEENWFFHNPTRSSVGSLGIVPKVPDDALTSPEYQVWRIKQGLIPGFVDVLINTPFFVELIQFHRVGAVKQRLYVSNLMEIRIPVLPLEEQMHIAAARADALGRIALAKKHLAVTSKAVEARILGEKTHQA
jgi:restriction endonuclease S subunit